MKDELRRILNKTMFKTTNVFNDEIYWSDEERSSNIKIEIRGRSLVITNATKYPSMKSVAQFDGWGSVLEMMRSLDEKIKKYW